MCIVYVVELVEQEKTTARILTKKNVCKSNDVHTFLKLFLVRAKIDR